MGHWVYEERPLNGGVGGEAFRIVFNGSGLEPAATLAREAIQNSVDASLDGEREVEIDFIIRELEGEARREFEEVASLAEIGARAKLLDLPSGTAFDHPKRPLRLLYVVDRGTTGLSGDPTESTSKLRKLLMEIGGSEKTQEEHSGGSYGFGKAVYGGSSRIATVFAYSRTRNADGIPISVLMGCAYHRGHVFDGAATTGRGFFGDVVEVAGKGLRFDPFTGDKADALAKSLGMPRDAGDFGTSILIVDTPLELRNICRGIEEYWWPRLSADLLDVVLEDADGSRPEPRPRQREDLRPFIDAFDVARLRTEIPGKSQCKTFNKLHGLSLGTLGLTVMPEPDLDDSEMALLPERQDTIALIRSPLMVVEYYGKRTMGLPPIAGAFLAHDDIDGILRRAEPPEHDRWAPNALRLDPEQHEHEIVKTILARMWRDLKSFQRSAKPEEAKRPKRLLRLERTLSDWFGSTARRPAPPAPHDAAPISIRPEVRVEAVNGGLKLSGSVLVALKPGIEVGELPVRIDLACLVREEEGVSSSDPVPLRVVHGAEVEAHEGYWVGLLAPERPIRLTLESEEYDPAWTVRFIPEVKPIDESGLS